MALSAPTGCWQQPSHSRSLANFVANVHFAKKRAKPHSLCKECVKVRKKCGFAHFLVLFLESAETPPFVQINVFAVHALRLDRKYTIVGDEN